jgi:hypothetical protein
MYKIPLHQHLFKLIISEKREGRNENVPMFAVMPTFPISMIDWF